MVTAENEARTLGDMTSIPVALAPNHSRTAFRRVVIVAAGACLAFAVWLALSIGGAPVTVWIDDGGTALAALISAALSLRAARRNADRRVFWLLLAAGLALWSVGEIVWGFYELVLHVDAPFPSIADIGYLAAIPFAVAAMAAYPTLDTVRATSRIREVLDGLIIATSVLFISWAYVLGPLVHQHGAGALETWVSLAYPVGDVVIASVALNAIHRGRLVGRAPLVVVAAGMLVNAGADSGFAYLTQIGRYVSGDLIDVGWFAAYVLFAVAALVPAATRTRSKDQRTSNVEIAVPYLALGLALVAAGTRIVTHRFDDQVLLWLLFSALALVLVRQVVALADLATHTKELAARTAELTVALDEANEASRMKSAFIANMSHEIRTPMNGLMGLLGLLLDRDLGEVERDYAETMGRSAEALMAVLNDVLDFSKLEAGRVEAEQVAVPIGAAVEDGVKGIASRAQAKNIRLTTRIAPDVPDVVLGDRLRLRQVLGNLLDNAIKFTECGEIGVDVTRAGPRLLRFEVTDTGIGIVGDGRTRLFDCFTQADMSTTRRFGGTGLGLAICKQLVELMGGDIGIDSEVGVGSTFWFTIAFEFAEPQLIRTVPLPSAQPIRTDPAPMFGGMRETILVAEDNAVNAKVAVAILHAMGYDAEVARDGVEALDALERQTYGAVLMDVQMPRLNGFDAAREIRRRGIDTPIIAMTAMAQECDRVASLEAGMNDYLSKPIDRDALAAMLRACVPERLATG